MNTRIKTKIRTSLQVLFLLLLAGSSFGDNIILDVLSFDRYIANSMKIKAVPGVAVVVVSQGDIKLIKGYGVKSTISKEPIETSSVFRLASVSKPLSAGLAGLLVNEKKMAWDDKVITYVPNLKLKSERATNHLTIRHILSHSSGMGRRKGNLIEAGLSRGSQLLSLPSFPMECQPGQCYRYKNFCFSLIEDVMQFSTNKTYATLMQEKIFSPLKMYHASIGTTQYLKTQNKALSHVKRNKAYVPTGVNKAYDTVCSSAGINASIEDVSKWLLSQMGFAQSVFPSKLLNVLQTPVISSPMELTRSHSLWRIERLKQADYALGWRVFNYAGEKVLYHSGMLSGVTSAVAFIPRLKVGIAVLANSNSFFPSNITARFLDIALNLSARDWVKLQKKH